jgi:chloride channel 2
MNNFDQMIAATLSFGLDTSIVYLNMLHLFLISLVSNIGLKYLIWISYTIVLATLAAYLTSIISVAAVGNRDIYRISKISGSGIPEVKSILNGVPNEQYLSFRTLIAKILGLSLARGSGTLKSCNI